MRTRGALLLPLTSGRLSTTSRWAGLLLATIALAQFMNLVASGYFAHGQSEATAPVQAEVVPVDQPPDDWLPVATRPGTPHVAVPPDRAADNRAAADGS